ncbi:MAG: NUDIX domain-containing protein [Bacteroidia bacterium]|jgi:8-oxo-dGTP diphosphatase|nr:NUDIX domain-containing protein [Bacteroidia bacterium]
MAHSHSWPQRPKSSEAGLNPHVSVDCVIFGFDEGELKVLLIERNLQKTDHESRKFSLPGNLVDDNEDLDTSAKRILKELTNLENIYMEQFFAFGDPNRVKSSSDAQWLNAVRELPTARVITVAYYSLVKIADSEPAAASFARKAFWCPVSEVPALAFDHNQILDKARQSLKIKLRMQPVGFELLPEKFTLGQLQRVYETILGTSLDKRNFRRKILNKGFLKALPEKQKGVPHKRALLYEFDKVTYDRLSSEQFNFDF